MASKSKRPGKRARGEKAYPRPQLVRGNWTNLNGPWDFAFDAQAAWSSPGEVHFEQTIEVPFAPETPASGIDNTGFFQAVWYRRTFKRRNWLRSSD